MKRNIIKMFIPALIMVTGAVNAAEIYNKNGNKLDFYGKVSGEHSFTTSNEHINIDSSYGQIGFKGETHINDQVTGYGQWEYHAKAGKTEGNQDSTTRLAFVGIKITDAGSLDYGRNYGIIHDVESYTDMAPSFLSETWDNNYPDNYMISRSANLLTYRNSNFFGMVDGLKFGVQYQGKNDRKNLKHANGDGIGVSLAYEANDGFSLIGAYSSANRTDVQKTDGKGDKTESWAVGSKYDANNIYLATVYTETSNMKVFGRSSNTLMLDSNGYVYDVANKTQSFELIAQYQFDFGLRPSISYIQTKGKNLEGISNHDLAKYVNTGVTYYFNKNFNVYGNYRFNLLSNEDAFVSYVSSDDQVTMGIAYQF